MNYKCNGELLNIRQITMLSQFLDNFHNKGLNICTCDVERVLDLTQSDKKMNRLRERFVNELNKGVDGARVIVVGVKLPTGAIETITNTEYIPEKLGYLMNAYDDQFKLKANPDVKIVGYMIV